MPESLEGILQRARVACLATCCDGQPYVSLMNVTYCRQERTVLMSTRRDSTKFRNLARNPRGALLVQDGSGQTAQALTLLGAVRVLEGIEDDRARLLHLAAHPQSAHFIQGAEIAMLAMSIERAVMSDQLDRVTVWPPDPR